MYAPRVLQLLALAALSAHADPLDVHPHDVWRLEVPNYPGAEATSATASVWLGDPPPGVPAVPESVPMTDQWHAVEAAEAMNVDAWHQAGFTGAGVKIAVFDIQWFGSDVDPALAHLPTHDCWVHESCMIPMNSSQPRFGYETGVHGYACAEVIADLAPDAELHLVRVNGSSTLENAVQWAIREEIDIISMSMSFFNGSLYDGTGVISDWMDDLAAHGILMVTSSGNYARGHWQGNYVDADQDGRMDFDGSNRLPIAFSAGHTRGAYVQWNEFRSCGGTDLEATMVDGEGFIVGRGDSVQRRSEDSCSAVERPRGHFETSDVYYLELRRHTGQGVELFVNVLAPEGRIDEAVRMPEGSIADPGSHPDVLTVGAIWAEGYLDNDIEGFSSRGPTLAGVHKPDIAGPDGLSTDAFGPAGFFGTSAATPAVAAVVALTMSQDPTLTPAAAAERVKGWALSDHASWEAPDPRWGAGRARLPVLETEPGGCGRGRLWLPLFLPPMWWFRRRGATLSRNSGSSPEQETA